MRPYIYSGTTEDTWYIYQSDSWFPTCSGKKQFLFVLLIFFLPPLVCRDKKKTKDQYFDKPVSEMEAEERRREKEISDSYDWKNIKSQKEIADAASAEASR